jgi:LacI family transcriptional regulator
MKQRILGYKAALIETDPSRIPQILYLNYNKEDSGPLIKQFVFEQHLDGLICANSSICYEVIEVIDTLNAETQKRIKIISYDDNRWLDYLKFQVSIIAQPIVEIGNAAVENLLQMVRNKKTDYGKKRELFFDITIIDRIT